MKCHLPQAISNCPSFSPQWMKWFFPKTGASTDNGCYYIFIRHFTFCSLLGRNSYKSLFTDAMSEVRWGWGALPQALAANRGTKPEGHVGKRTPPGVLVASASSACPPSPAHTGRWLSRALGLYTTLRSIGRTHSFNNQEYFSVLGGRWKTAFCALKNSLFTWRIIASSKRN